MRYILLGLMIFGFGCQSPEETKKEQFYVEGLQVYKQHCANCHQVDGKGLANLYPAINKSAFINQPQKLLCLIRNGSQNLQKVQKMPANTDLKPLDLAVLLTYLQKEWGSKNELIETANVEKMLNGCGK